MRLRPSRAGVTFLLGLAFYSKNMPKYRRALLCSDGQKRFFSKPNSIGDAIGIIKVRCKLVNGPLPTPCEEWLGARKIDRYGYIMVNGKSLPTHRLSWIGIYGQIPPRMEICHHCDNPPCCNPKHLFLGTHQDNMDDCIAKGRAVTLRGEEVGNSKLTSEEVLEIRKRHAGGTSYRELREQFGIGNSMIWYIVKRVWWKHI